MGQLVVIFVLLCMAACADAVPGDELPDFDGAAGSPAFAPTLITDRDPAPLYQEVAGGAAPAMTPTVTAGAPAPSDEPEEQEVPAAGAPAPEQPAPGGSGGAGGSGGSGGSAGAPVDPVDPGPATPEQPERFCKITSGRFQGQTLG